MNIGLRRGNDAWELVVIKDNQVMILLVDNQSAHDLNEMGIGAHTNIGLRRGKDGWELVFIKDNRVIILLTDDQVAEDLNDIGIEVYKRQ